MQDTHNFSNHAYQSIESKQKHTGGSKTNTIRYLLTRIILYTQNINALTCGHAASPIFIVDPLYVSAPRVATWKWVQRRKEIGHGESVANRVNYRHSLCDILWNGKGGQGRRESVANRDAYRYGPVGNVSIHIYCNCKSSVRFDWWRALAVGEFLIYLRCVCNKIRLLGLGPHVSIWDPLYSWAPMWQLPCGSGYSIGKERGRGDGGALPTVLPIDTVFGISW